MLVDCYCCCDVSALTACTDAYLPRSARDDQHHVVCALLWILLSAWYCLSVAALFQNPVVVRRVMCLSMKRRERRCRIQ